MRLSRQKIQQMVKAGDVNIGGRKTGGGSGAGGGGGVSATWVDDNYISKEFFNRLFTVHGTDENDDEVVVEPNDTETDIDNLETLVDFWSDGAVSALGQGEGGGGGGGATTLPGLFDVDNNLDQIAQPGQVLTYDGTHWTAGNAASGSVTSVAMSVPTGFKVTGSPINASNPSGTLAVTFDGSVTKGYVLAAPSAAAGAPDWRALVADDIPDLPLSKISGYPTTWWGAAVTSQTVSGVTTYKVEGNMSRVGSIIMSDDITMVFTHDLSKGDNDVSDTAWKGYRIKDKGNRNSVQYINSIYENGTNEARISVYNYDTNGVQVGDLGITLDMDKQGNLLGTYQGTSYFSGNVGVGTNSPYTSLHVNGGVLATKIYLYKPNVANDTGAVYFIKDSTGVKLEGAGFYTDYFVSALGASSGGGGGGGSTTLYGLLDVNIPQSMTSANDGQVLTYSSSQGKWINQSPSISGYLPLTGGTLTGAVAVNGGITPIASGVVTTPSMGNKLWIKQAYAATDGTPNNGLVLEYGGSSTWTGQLYMADNGQQGLYWGGWYNGVRQEWTRILDTRNTYVTSGKGYINGTEITTISGNAATATSATSATKLSDATARTAWGQIFFTGGQPQSISGNMTGVGSITASDDFSMVVGTFDLSKTDNNLSSIIYKGFRIKDSLGRNSVQFIDVADTDGSNGFRISAYNYKTTGTTVSQVADKGLTLYVYKDGTSTLSIDTSTSIYGALTVSGNTAISGSSFTWGGNTVATQPWVKSIIQQSQHNALGTWGSDGWICVATITVVGTWATQPIRFRVTQRNVVGGEITLRFWGASSAGSESVAYFFYTGNIAGAVITKSSNVYSLYIQKSEANDSIGISLVDWGSYMTGRVTVAWEDTQVSSAPSGTAATCRYYFSSSAYLEFDSTNGGIHAVSTGFYADNYVSVLGQGSGGGGGGATLNEPLNTINGIRSNPTGSNKILVYNGSSWVYEDKPSGGGSGGSGTVTSITAGTGLSGGTITTSGTIAINSTYQTYISNGQTAYGWGNHASQGYWNSSNHPTTIANYGITDAKISNGTITLGGNTITPLTSHQTVSGTFWGKSWSNGNTIKGTITDDYFTLYSSNTNPYLKLGGSTTDWKVQVTGNYMYIGNGTSTSIRTDDSGRVGIGGAIVNTNYKLTVYGVIYTNTGLYSAGYVTALSDIRKKDVRERFLIPVEEIAGASLIRFVWNDREDKRMHVGGIAQEWQRILPEAVIEASDGTLSMDYSVIGVASCISLANALVNLTQRVERLEKAVMGTGT